jgi:hypothetical protein
MRLKRRSGGAVSACAAVALLASCVNVFASVARGRATFIDFMTDALP